MVQKKTTATRVRKKSTTAAKPRKATTVKKKTLAKRPQSSTSKLGKAKMSRAKVAVASSGRKPRKQVRENLPVSYQSFEKELNRFYDLLESVGLRGRIVKKSLAYLEKEQRRLNKQLLEAKRFLTRLKNRSLKAWHDFPEQAEEIFRQLKSEFNRLSKRLGLAL